MKCEIQINNMPKAIVLPYVVEKGIWIEIREDER